MKTYVILEDIRSTYNVGAIFRTADAAGVERVLLAGYTPRPVDRFGRPVGAIQKTSLGASETVAWEACSDIVDRIRQLQAAGVTVVAVEQTSKSVSLSEFTPPPAVAYVFGNEVDGVSAAVLAAVDQVVEVPMRGAKESLNVSVCAGVVLFHGVCSLPRAS